MKFLKTLSALVIASVALALSEGPDGNMQIDVQTNYGIVDKPEVGFGDVAHYEIGDETTLEYVFASAEEDVEVTIIGTGGVVQNAATHEVVYNLTSKLMDPMLQTQANRTYTFKQDIEIDFAAGNYILVPEIYIVINKEQTSRLPVRSQLMIVTDPNVSLYDPQFLFLVIISLAAVGGISYLAFSTVTRPVQTKLTKKQVLAAASKSKATGSSFNEDWIPDHLKKTKTQRTKKQK